MGLSSQLAPSAIAKPGVIANAAARPASPYQGQVVFQTDTNQAFVWNGSAWVLLSTGTANPPGLELVKTQTVGTAVASVTVTNAFSTTYDNYRIVVSGGTSSSLQAITMQLGSTTTGYDYVMQYFQFSGGAATTLAASNTSGWSYAGEAGNANVMCVDIFGPYTATYTKMSGFYMGSVAGFTSCQLANTTSYTDFKLSVAGTISSSSIAVYGYKK